MKKEISYQTLLPNYPKKGFIAILFLLSGDSEKKILVPMMRVYQDIHAAAENIKHEIGRSKLDDVLVMDECILIPVRFKSFFPLKREYWVENATIQYDMEKRISLFIQLAKNSQMYHLLVTPWIVEDNGEVVTNAALPLRDPNDVQMLEHFMYNVDLPVDEKATHAAIYSLGRTKIFNWKTKKLNSPKGVMSLSDEEKN